MKTFFDQKEFLKTLGEWILFFVKDDELQKCILRQHQSRAVEKIAARCEDVAKRTGLIWRSTQNPALCLALRRSSGGLGSASWEDGCVGVTRFRVCGSIRSE